MAYANFVFAECFGNGGGEFGQLDALSLCFVVAYVVSSVEGARDVSSFASEDHISGVRLDGAQEVHQSSR